MIVAQIAMIAFIFVLFFAPNVSILVVGEVLCGLPWGVFQTLAPQYASEVGESVRQQCRLVDDTIYTNSV